MEASRNMLHRHEPVPFPGMPPGTIAWLQVPLNPARAARLAEFTEQTGISAQDLMLDLMDDAIYDTARRASEAEYEPQNGHSEVCGQ